MDPREHYDLRPGEWRPDAPRVGYTADLTGLVGLIARERHAHPWTSGTSDQGPVVEVDGRRLSSPPNCEDVTYLESLATPAPYGRGEQTLLDPQVRDALQIEPERIRLTGPGWDGLYERIVRTVKADMGLEDTRPELVLTKLLIYRPGGHFAPHSDTEKAPGMVASAILVAPGAHTGGALRAEHHDRCLHACADGSERWRWAAWYADTRHTVEPVETGTRIALAFGIVIAPEQALAPRKPRDSQIGWSVWERTYAHWHTRWAAREHRTRAGEEQYGQKIVWVLEHRYTEPGLRASLLKGRDRDVARVLVEESESEACLLGWLRIRQTGPAHENDRGNAIWGDHTVMWHGSDLEEEDDDPMPESMLRDHWSYDHDWGIRRVAHRETPELHLKSITRRNAWVEGLRTFDGESCDYGPIEVLDGELAPAKALAQATPDGARVYEATGNEGASLELQYRQAIIVLWRRNSQTLRMLARCAGRLGLARELDRRRTHARRESLGSDRDLKRVFSLWREAARTDGGEPAARAHELLLEQIEACRPAEHEDLRERYVEQVAATDLDAGAVPALVRWLRAAHASGNDVERWTSVLREACSPRHTHASYAGAAALCRALCETPDTHDLAVAMLAHRHEPPTDLQGVLEQVAQWEERRDVQAWIERQRTKHTRDDPPRDGAD